MTIESIQERTVLLYLLNNITNDRRKNEELMDEMLKEEQLKNLLSTFIDVYEKNKKGKK